MYRNALLLVVGALLCTPVFAQSSSDCYPSSSVLDGSYARENMSGRRASPQAPLREADVMWSKRIWRKIDLRQKFNQKLYYPLQPLNSRRSLYDALMCHIMVEGDITAYDPGPLGDNDSFEFPMTAAQVEDICKFESVQMTIDPDTDEEVPVTVTTEVETAEVTQFVIKEEWFIDKQRGVLDVRILGLAPVREVYDMETGDFKGYQIMFWVYWPHARQILAQELSFNHNNDTRTFTYEEIFTKRMFHSYIIKESNVYDRSISEYKKGLNALLEEEEIHKGIRNFESDLWAY